MSNFSVTTEGAYVRAETTDLGEAVQVSLTPLPGHRKFKQGDVEITETEHEGGLYIHIRARPPHTSRGHHAA